MFLFSFSQITVITSI